MGTETLPSLINAENSLQKIQQAIQTKDYGTLQGLLLHQAAVLHEIGMTFVDKSNDQDQIRYKRTCLDLALRALNQSRKTMESIKSLGR